MSLSLDRGRFKETCSSGWHPPDLRVLEQVASRPQRHDRQFMQICGASGGFPRRMHSFPPSSAALR
ncbi:hypothetical protein CO676_07900 [Sinorhizobium sp. BJ1]|nr:hypothetical protein CO676_07900 [Sinorhizobium sp. BJ1]